MNYKGSIVGVHGFWVSRVVLGVREYVLTYLELVLSSEIDLCCRVSEIVDVQVCSGFPIVGSIVDWAFCQGWFYYGLLGIDSQPIHLWVSQVMGFPGHLGCFKTKMIEVWIVCRHPHDLVNLHCPSWKVLDGQGLQSATHQWQGI